MNTLTPAPGQNTNVGRVRALIQLLVWRRATRSSRLHGFHLNIQVRLSTVVANPFSLTRSPKPPVLLLNGLPKCTMSRCVGFASLARLTPVQAGEMQSSITS